MNNTSITKIFYRTFALLFFVCAGLFSGALTADAATISGNCSGSGPLTFYKNGSTTAMGNATCSANPGVFTFSGSWVDGDLIVALHAQRMAVIETNGANINNIDMIYPYGVRIYTQGTHVMTNSDLDTANNGQYLMTDFYQDGTGSNLVLTFSNNSLMGSVVVYGSYTPGGNVTFPAASTDTAFNVTGSGVFNLGTHTITNAYTFACDTGSTCNVSNGSLVMNSTYTGSQNQNYWIDVPAPMTIKNLTMIDSVNGGYSRTVHSNQNLTVTGVLRLDGLDSDDRLLLTDIQNITLSGSATFSSTGYLTVQNSTAIDNSSNVTLPLLGVQNAPPYNSNEGIPGTTVGWFAPPNIGGRAFNDVGITPVPNGTVVRLIVWNGTSAQSQTTTTFTDANGNAGTYLFTGVNIQTGHVMLVHLDGYTKKGLTVSQFNVGNVLDFHVYGDTAVVRNERTASNPITNQMINLVADGDTDVTALIANASGTLLTMNNPSSVTGTLMVREGSTYTTGGTVNSAGHIKIQGTMNVAANPVTLSGYFTLYTVPPYAAPQYNATGGTLTLAGATNSVQQYTNPNVLGSNFRMTKTGGTINATTAVELAVGRNLTLDYGANTPALSLFGNSLTANILSNDATISLWGNQAINLTQQDTNSGAWWYIGMPNSTVTVKDFGAVDYYDLIVRTTNNVTLGSPLSVTNLKLDSNSSGSGVFNTAGRDVSIAGIFDMPATTRIAFGASAITMNGNLWQNYAPMANIDPGTSTVTFTHASPTLRGPFKYHNFTAITPMTVTIDPTNNGNTGIQTITGNLRLRGTGAGSKVILTGPTGQGPNNGFDIVGTYSPARVDSEYVTIPNNQTHSVLRVNGGYLPDPYFASSNSDHTKGCNIAGCALGWFDTNPAVIISFTASPSALPTGGGTTTLSWITSGASSCSINQGIGSVPVNGSLPVSLTTTTTYTLTCNPGSVSANTTVVVATPGPASTITMTADPGGPLSSGDSTTVYWTMNTAGGGPLTDTCTLTSSNPLPPHFPQGFDYDSEPVPLSEYWPNDPVVLTQTTTFTMTCAGGASDSVTVVVDQPTQFRALPILYED